MIERQIECTFCASLKFGVEQINKIIVAKDKQDALKTIQEYYDEPIIISIVSFKEIIDLLDETKERQDLFIVLEAVLGDEGVDFITHREYGKSIEDLQEKYRNKDTVILSPSGLNLLLNSILISIQNEDVPLISDFYHI